MTTPQTQCDKKTMFLKPTFSSNETKCNECVPLNVFNLYSKKDGTFTMADKIKMADIIGKIDSERSTDGKGCLIARKRFIDNDVTK